MGAPGCDDEVMDPGANEEACEASLMQDPMSRVSHLAVYAVLVVEQGELLRSETLDLDRRILHRLPVSSSEFELDRHCLS